MDRPIVEKYLNFPEPTKHLTPEVAELLIDTFEKVYPGICDFFNKFRYISGLNASA